MVILSGALFSLRHLHKDRGEREKGAGTLEQFPCKPERNTKDKKNQIQIRRPQKLEHIRRISMHLEHQL
jgi:hypothetical protein